MFSSFFPTPRLFFPAVLIWTALSMALWYGLARDMGPAWAEMWDTFLVIKDQWDNRKQWRESGGGAIHISNSKLSRSFP